MVYISTSCLKGANSKFTKDVFKVLKVYEKHNIKNIELGSVHSYVKDLGKIKKYQKKTGANFIIHGFFPPEKKPFFLNFASKNKDILKRSFIVAKSAIELCNELDSNLYSVLGGIYADMDINENPLSDKIPYEDAVELASESLNELCDYASDYSVRIAVENMTGLFKDGFLVSFAAFNDLFNRVKAKNLGVLFDIGHVAVAKTRFGIDAENIIDKMEDRLFEMHVHKSVGGKDTHFNIDSASLLRGFDKGLLRKTILTLEATRLSPAEILKGQRIIEEALI